ncbi:signal recognition particle receptor subunit alpha [Klebsiella pneumoniae]|nr:signal recognition particle receptor subunit alpha [Klebsiella pneumoniae]
MVQDFISRVKESAVGHEVNKSLTPGQEFVKIVRNELVAAMGEENQMLDPSGAAAGRGADGYRARCW